MSEQAPNDTVGPVLEACARAQAVVRAIRAFNADVTVQDRGSYLRVLVRQRCVLSRALVERELGEPFALPAELEAIMPSFKGVLQISADEVVWTW